MTRKTGSRRRWLLAFPIGLAALVIGSVFGAAQNGAAASKVAPNNTAPPVISGTTAVGSTLTTTNGTFTGTAPLTYTYQWQRAVTKTAQAARTSAAQRRRHA